MAGNNGGPWGGGGNGSDDDRDRPTGGRRPGNEPPQIPEIDEIMNKGREQLRVLMGGGKGRGNGPGGEGGGGGPMLTRGTVGLGAVAAFALWLFASVYTVGADERSVELFLGEFSDVGEPGLNFAPWPVVTAEVIPVTREQTVQIGDTRQSGFNQSSQASAAGRDLMLTTDENVVDVDFQVVWVINNPADFLFNLAGEGLEGGQTTVQAVAESAMREVIARSELAPILNRDRAATAVEVRDLIQATLESYEAGITVVRVNLQAVEPPSNVVEIEDLDGNLRRTSPLNAFRDVQAAEQERDRLQRTADAYANRVLAEARGQAAQLLEQAEGYRAQVVNEAVGEASRFTSVLQEYAEAPEVTRKRLYLETVERVLGQTEIFLMDGASGEGQGVVPYLPLNELRRSGGSN